MASTVEEFEGGCLCGAVRFVATGKPNGTYWCHCHSCRKHTGAPAAVVVEFDGNADSQQGRDNQVRFDSG